MIFLRCFLIRMSLCSNLLDTRFVNSLFQSLFSLSFICHYIWPCFFGNRGGVILASIINYKLSMACDDPLFHHSFWVFEIRICDFLDLWLISRPFKCNIAMIFFNKPSLSVTWKINQLSSCINDCFRSLKVLNFSVVRSFHRGSDIIIIMVLVWDTLKEWKLFSDDS